MPLTLPILPKEEILIFDRGVAFNCYISSENNINHKNRQDKPLLISHY